MNDKIIIALPMIKEVVEKAKDTFDVIYDAERNLEMEELLELSHKHLPIGLMIAMRHRITAEVLAMLPASIKIIATTSVGHDHIDLESARQKGIFITNTPDVLTDATADQAFLLMLAAARKLPEALETMKNGWGKTMGFGERLGRDLRGKNLAIYGMGRIGQALADRARAFGMNILYSNRKRLPKELEKEATFYESLEAMLPHAQVLSLNAPATKETEKIMNQKTFSLLPKEAIFINVARGNLVDENALYDVLKSGHLFAAGLDVFLNEPNFDKRFLEFPNVVLSPHIGSATLETRTEMGLKALSNIEDVLKGEKPRDSLN